jgi:uncharacterized protein (DUF2147 family)
MAGPGVVEIKMHGVMRMLALGAGLLMAGQAMASPAGLWELETADTRFELQLCGDGTQLCGQLVWLKDVDYNEQYKPYLNTPMAAGVRQTGPNRWKGDMRLMGQSISGTITQQSEDHMTLQGCAFLVVCKTYQMYRVSP